jgi:hypothetical protein
MNYIKSPLQEKKKKLNRRKVISGGEPAKRKRRSIFSSSNGGNGSSQNYGTRKRAEKSRKKSTLPAFTPWKVILGCILIGMCGLFYINHVFSTQQTLEEVQQLENNFNKTRRIYNEQRLEYDRMIGPKEIYQQAREQGFVNAGPADQIITLEP